MAEIRGLYAITDPTLTPGDSLFSACEQALRGGARLLQYRDKTAEPALKRRRARQLRALCRDHGVLFLINDDPRLAAEAEADGVHVGQQDMAVAEARELLGDGALIGVSCHQDPELARRMVAAGADYVAFGRFFPSRTKPEASPASVSVLATPLQVPKVAIGGVTPDNAAPLVRAGASALAVIHALFASNDIEGTARAFARLFPEA